MPRWARFCLSTGAIVVLAVVLNGGCGGSNFPGSPTSPGGSGNAGGSSVVLNDDFGGRALFPASNWWNQDISNAPVDANSAAFITFIGTGRTLHPDFGPPPYGIPYVGVS